VKPIGKAAQGVTDAAHAVGVEIDMSELAGRLEREAMRVINDLTQQGLSGEALADRVHAALMNLSDGPVMDAARGASSEAFNLGRNLGAQAAGDVSQVVRTEILDQNTCDPCRDLDGKEVEMNSEEYFALMPPNLCDGRDLCRGFYIYVSEAGA
jgi:hypothetical protein